MKKYFSQLRPVERRWVIGVGVLLVLVLNWAYIWPHFSDFTNDKNRLEAANDKLAKYRKAIDEMPSLQTKIKKYENEGEFVAPEDQAIDLMRTIQSQAAASGFGIQSFSPTRMSTNQFFVEQIQNINVLAPEPNLVDFLFKLGTSSSMIRVRDLSLQPDPPRQRLTADIRLVASYQKNPKTSSSKTTTAKAK